MVDRTNCPMQHLNWNCLPVDDFCTTVNDEICDGLKQAYECGMQNRQKESVKPVIRQEMDDICSSIDDVAYCGKCGTRIGVFKRNYCSNCGMAVKWDE